MKSFIKSNFKRFNQRIRTISNSRYISNYFKFFYCAVRHGCSPDDYFRYEFYKKNDSERKKFITYGRSKRIIKKYNDSKYTDIFENKCKFNTKFKDFIYREWIDIGKCSFDEFNEFLFNHKEVIIKPVDEGSGRGVLKVKYTNKQDSKQLYKMHNSMIMESVINQHELMNKLNPSSVNTIRVVTFNNCDEINIIASSIRLGIGNSVVDNLHSGGICASVDKYTGKVSTYGINQNLERFIIHPTTNEEILGFTVPKWDLIIKTVVEAAKIVPQVKYVGWDIVILEEGIELLEANHDPAHDLIQMIDQVGKYDYFR